MSKKKVIEAINIGDTLQFALHLPSWTYMDECPDFLNKLTLIHYITLYGNTAMLDLVLEHGANLEVTANGETPLLTSMHRKSWEMVRALLDRGANIHVRNGDLWTPLHYACSNGVPVDIAANIIEKGADVNAKTGVHSLWTPLHTACTFDRQDLAILLLKKGAMINVHDSEGLTPLHFACQRNNLDMVKLLMHNGASLGARDKRYWTPLHRAIECGHKDVVKYLVEIGAPIEDLDLEGNTPLHVAAIKEKYDMYDMLVSMGADINALNKSSHTPEQEKPTVYKHVGTTVIRKGAKMSLN